MVPRSSVSNLRKSKQNSAIVTTVQEQNDTPTESRNGPTHSGRRSRRTSHPNTSCVRNLLQRWRSETSKQGRCIADTAAPLMSMTARVGYCISDHLAKPRSCTVGQRNCIAKGTVMLSFRKRCSLSKIFVGTREHKLCVNTCKFVTLPQGASTRLATNWESHVLDRHEKLACRALG